MSYAIATDIHTHTLYSRHAYSTIGENIAAAHAAGLELLGSADHFSSMLHGTGDIRDYQFFLNLRTWPRVWQGVTLLRAAEVDILSIKGELFGQALPSPVSIVGSAYKNEASIFDRVVENLDYLVASVHNREFARGESKAACTDMYVRVLQNPKVLVLGHVGRSGVPFDVDELLSCAKSLNKLIEINEHSLDERGDTTATCRKIAARCAELGVGITVSSDAHVAPRIGRYPNVRAMLEEIHFPQELIMNRSRDALLDALFAARVCDLRALKGGADPEPGLPA